MRMIALTILMIALYREGTSAYLMLIVGLLIIHAEITAGYLRQIKESTDSTALKASIYSEEIGALTEIVGGVIVREIKRNEANTGSAKELKKTEGKATS